MFKSMVDMARSPAEIKKEAKAYDAPIPQSASKYPWGLCLRLEEESLEKLGLEGDDLPDIGDMIHIVGMGEVTSARSEKCQLPDGTTKVNRCVEIQITHLAPPEDEDREYGEGRRNTMYADEEAGEDAEAA